MKRKPKLEKLKQVLIVEKNNHNAVHGIFASVESAERFLRDTTPVYVAKGYYMDKSLTAESFEVIVKEW